ncbi:polysaccharide deacetylase family protein [Planotetraspora sp. A-T 1434]|uniref:polysaccharide deacetylase family protein n=1 Tax=Planotetraspora sp. A-T 1434 TaxID=2979219 RepID=UPI0021C2542D|nr:polysaccharide deacetylase family protein [Planotetraspora sp. A-T 1434]MCT9930212.1 polysaccharide deacetylase family protein [Planotetraspora sp. A-T 1434]
MKAPMRRRGFLLLAGLWTAASGCSGQAPGLAARPEPAPATKPVPTPGPVPRRLPPEVEHGPRNRPLVALTFHGAGPRRLAEQVLAAIERTGGAATILAVGTWLDQYPAIARRILDGGHDLGNHTQHHLDISTMDASAAREEIEECAARLRALTGSAGSWFRPSASRVATPLIRRLSADAGYRTCLSYDVDSLDYTDPGPAAVTANVLSAVRPGSIISLHLGHPGTAAALPAMLDGLKHKALRPVTVTALLAP